VAKPIIRIINDKKVPVAAPFEPIEYLMQKYHQDTLDFLQKNN